MYNYGLPQNKVRNLTLNPDETIMSFDVVSFFTRQLPMKQNQLCLWSDLQAVRPLLHYNIFQNQQQVPQTHAIGSPLSPIVANLYIKEVESKSLGSFKGSFPATGTDMWMTPESKSNPKN